MRPYGRMVSLRKPNDLNGDLKIAEGQIVSIPDVGISDLLKLISGIVWLKVTFVTKRGQAYNVLYENKHLGNFLCPY